MRYSNPSPGLKDDDLFVRLERRETRYVTRPAARLYKDTASDESGFGVAEFVEMRPTLPIASKYSKHLL